MRRCPSTGRALGGDSRLIGQLIDRRYRIVRLLGDGPFGAVYKAEHVTVGRQVALRILPTKLFDHPEALQRFFREARLMSSVNHPRLQPLVDAGLASEGVAYVAYQYIRGRSLAATLATEAPMPLEQTATLICQILEGVDAIHCSGFVHRAISPECVLMQSVASGLDTPVLSNFGAAALEHPDGTSEKEGSPPPTVFVPPPYCPSERLRGAKPDRREDVYAVGVLLAACLSPGGVPRYGSGLLAMGVPPTIEAIVARAAHNKPVARYGSAEEMASHLVPFAALKEEDLASATKTHISDLRILSRRERALATLPSRVRFAADPAAKVQVDAAYANLIFDAIENVAPKVAYEALRRVPGYVQRDRNRKVPLLVMAAALEEVDLLAGANDRLFCTLVGEEAVEMNRWPIEESEIRNVPPEFFFDQSVPKLFRNLTGGNVRTSQVGRGYGRVVVRDQQEPSLALCSCAMGMVSAALKKLGARSVEVNKTSCESVGDPACVFSATWS